MKILLDLSGPAIGARPVRKAVSRRKTARNARLDFDEVEALAGWLGARTLERGNLVAEERPRRRRLQLGRRMAWGVRNGYRARNRDL